MDAADRTGGRWLGWLVIGSGVVGAVIFGAMIRVVGALDPSVGAIQFTFTEAAFRRILDAWGPEGRVRFATHFTYDYVFLGCFGLFGWALGAWLAGRLERPRWLRALLPWVMPAAAVGDAVEDVLQQSLAAAIPGSRPALAYLVAGVAATLKWALIAMFIAFVGWAAWLVRRDRTTTSTRAGR